MTELVFNHHSLPFTNAEEARAKAPDFIRIWLATKRFGFQTIRIAPELDSSWHRIELAPSYTWSDWVGSKDRNDGPSRELVQAFKAMATKTPLIDATQEDCELCEVRTHPISEPLDALQAAYLLSSPLLSHPTNSSWSTDPLACAVRKFHGDDLVDESITLVNLATLAAVQRNRSSLEAERSRLSSSAKALLSNWTILFPRVVCCGEVDSTLHYWSFGDPGLAFFRRVLEALNEVCESWHQEHIHFPGFIAALSNLAVRCSDESDSTKAHFPVSRRFRLPNGKAADFWLHAKGSILRVHFLPDEENKKVYVGYCGHHLPT